MPESEAFYNSMTNTDTLPKIHTTLENRENENSATILSNLEFTGPGSVYQVFKQYNKFQADESGIMPTFIKSEEPEKKNKNRLN